MRATVISIAVIHFVVYNVNAARILGLFPHSGRSHQMVFEPLLQLLAERGHQMTVVSFFPRKHPLQNYTDVSLEGLDMIGVETYDTANYAKSTHLEKRLGMNIVTDTFGFWFLRDKALRICRGLVQLQSLRDTLQKDYDLVIVENFNSDCMLGLLDAYNVRVPIVAVSSCNLMPWSAARLGVEENPAYVPLLHTTFTNKMTLMERTLNTVSKYITMLWFRYTLQAEEQNIIEKSLGRKVTDLHTLSKNVSLLISNTFHSINGVRPVVPGMVEVAGMHLNNKRTHIPKHIESFLNASDAGVILFSWGSLIKTSTIPVDIEEVIVKTLNRFPQRVIWKYEDSGPEGNLTGNILKVSWLPQYDLLQHKKVVAFIGHGGLLGMTEAIAAGKPLLVIPFFGDQPNNGAMAEAAGIGTMLRYDEITEQTFYEAVKTVLRPQVRMNAKRHSEIWRDRPMSPLDTAVYWVERVARWGHAAPLHLPARDMPLYQRALLDVIAVIVISILFVLFTIYAIFKTVFRILRALFHTEPKKKVH